MLIGRLTLPVDVFVKFSQNVLIFKNIIKKSLPTQSIRNDLIKEHIYYYSNSE